MTAPALRPYLPKDAPVLAELFQLSVEELTQDDYDADQRLAWAAVADDVADFGNFLGSDVCGGGDVVQNRLGALKGNIFKQRAHDGALSSK